MKQICSTFSYCPPLVHLGVYTRPWTRTKTSWYQLANADKVHMTCRASGIDLLHNASRIDDNDGLMGTLDVSQIPPYELWGTSAELMEG